MKKKCFILLICVVVGLFVFGAVSCSKRLNPFNPSSSGSSGNDGSGENGGDGGGEVIPPIDPPVEPPIDPPDSGEDEPDWFLPPEEQIEPFMETKVLFRSEAGPEEDEKGNPIAKKYIEYQV